MAYVWRGLGALVVLALVAGLNFLVVSFGALSEAMGESSKAGAMRQPEQPLVLQIFLIALACAPTIALLVGYGLSLAMTHRRNDILAFTFAAVFVGFFVAFVAAGAIQWD